MGDADGGGGGEGNAPSRTALGWKVLRPHAAGFSPELSLHVFCSGMGGDSTLGAGGGRPHCRQLEEVLVGSTRSSLAGRRPS